MHLCFCLSTGSGCLGQGSQASRIDHETSISACSHALTWNLVESHSKLLIKLDDPANTAVMKKMTRVCCAAITSLVVNVVDLSYMLDLSVDAAYKTKTFTSALQSHAFAVRRISAISHALTQHLVLFTHFNHFSCWEWIVPLCAGILREDVCQDDSCVELYRMKR